MRSFVCIRLLVLVCALARPASADPIPLILAFEPRGGGTFSSTLQSFLNEVRENPDLQGVIELRTAPLSFSEVAEAVRAGAIDLGLVMTGQIERFGPQPVSLFNQPAVFADLEELAFVEDSWLGAAALSELASADLVGLAFWNFGMTQFAADEALENLDDFRGRKILTASSLRSEVIQGIGASPVQLPFGEVYTALQRGVADTAEVSIEAALSFAGTFTHITEANYRPLVAVLVANREKWHSLPDQAQFVLAELAREAGQRSTAFATAAAEDARSALREQDVTFASLGPEARESFRQASLRTWEEQQPSEVVGYLSDALDLIGSSRTRRGGGQPAPPPLRRQREGALELEIVFASDRNDEQVLFPDKPIEPRFRLGSKRLPNEHYCGTAVIRIDPKRPFANESSEYFELSKLELINWGNDGEPCRRFLQAKVKGSSVKSIFLFVHGYNNTFFDAVKRAASLAKDISFHGVILAWSWPAAGGALDYGYDGDSAVWTGPHFRKLLDALHGLDGLNEFYLLSHSMGARIIIDVTEPLPDPANEDDWLNFNHLVFIAPDVATDVFRDQNLKARRFAKWATLYASSDDRAIRISSRLHKAPRAGLGGFDNIVVQKGLDSIDTTGLDRRFISNRHAYAFDRPRGVVDLRALIIEDTPPEKRGLQRKEKQGLPYWLLAP